jgi:Tfp pilus assembly pilus retraction ATPase PilT
MIVEILKLAHEKKASDILLSPLNYPALKVSGEIMYLEEYGIMQADILEKEIFSITPEAHREKFKNTFELDFSFCVERKVPS